MTFEDWYKQNEHNLMYGTVREFLIAAFKAGVEEGVRRDIEGPPEEIGTGIYRLASGEVVGNEPESLIGF